MIARQRRAGAPTGLVAAGWRRDLTFWWAEAAVREAHHRGQSGGERLILAESDGRASLRLHLNGDGSWSGRALQDASIAVELTSVGQQA